MSLLLALVLAQPAHADGTVTVREKVAYPIQLWIDGNPVGVVKKEHDVDLPAGVHELWFAMDDDATYTYCHGTVDVTDGGVVELSVKPRGCEGFTTPDAIGPETTSKGALVTFRMPAGEQYCCSVMVDANGKYPFVVGPNRSLNLAPGEHHIEVSAQSSADRILDRGLLKLDATEPKELTCSEQGCLGIVHP